MAFLVVITWHLYNAHLAPEVFPFNKSIFTGRISREAPSRARAPGEHERRWRRGPAAGGGAAAAMATPPRPRHAERRAWRRVAGRGRAGPRLVASWAAAVGLAALDRQAAAGAAADARHVAWRPGSTTGPRRPRGRPPRAPAAPAGPAPARAVSTPALQAHLSGVFLPDGDGEVACAGGAGHPGAPHVRTATPRGPRGLPRRAAGRRRHSVAVAAGPRGPCATRRAAGGLAGTVDLRPAPGRPLLPRPRRRPWTSWRGGRGASPAQPAPVARRARTVTSPRPWRPRRCVVLRQAVRARGRRRAPAVAGLCALVLAPALLRCGRCSRWGAARSLTAPLAVLTHAAARIAAGDLGAGPRRWARTRPAGWAGRSRPCDGPWTRWWTSRPRAGGARRPRSAPRAGGASTARCAGATSPAGSSSATSSPPRRRSASASRGSCTTRPARPWPPSGCAGRRAEARHRRPIRARRLEDTRALAAADPGRRPPPDLRPAPFDPGRPRPPARHPLAGARHLEPRGIAVRCEFERARGPPGPGGRDGALPRRAGGRRNIARHAARTRVCAHPGWRPGATARSRSRSRTTGGASSPPSVAPGGPLRPRPRPARHPRARSSCWAAPPTSSPRPGAARASCCARPRRPLPVPGGPCLRSACWSPTTTPWCGRASGAAAALRGHRGGGRSRGRTPGGRGVPAAAARRGPHGHRDAGAGRPGGRPGHPPGVPARAGRSSSRSTTTANTWRAS